MTALALTTDAKPATASGLTLLPRKTARELASLPDQAEVERECAEAIEAARPAPLDVFAVAVERLALHYPESRLTPREQALVLADWRRLLGHLPADLMAEGVDAYVMSEARFFPTPGQFMKTIEGRWSVRQILAKRAAETLALITAKPALPISSN